MCGENCQSRHIGECFLVKVYALPGRVVGGGERMKDELQRMNAITFHLSSFILYKAGFEKVPTMCCLR